MRGRRALGILIGLGMTASALAETPMQPCLHLWRWTECAIVPLRGAASDLRAKKFESPPANRAWLYIVRSSTIEPKALSTISIDGKTIGKLAPMTYFLVELMPGRHYIQARTNHDFAVEVNAEAGKTLFIGHRLTLTLISMHGRLELLTSSDGKAMVGKSSRAASALDSEQ